MTLKHHWKRTALLVLPAMIASCAVSRPPSAPPPRLLLPARAAASCVLARLPERPTRADLEVGYLERGLQLVACEQARALAIDTLVAERAMQDRWLRETEAGRKSPIRVW